MAIKIKLILLSAFALGIWGCATAPRGPAAVSLMHPKGVYHQVEKGQTIWMIAKLYGVDMDELVRRNNLYNASHIEAGQTLWIPNPGKEKPVISGKTSSQYQEEGFIWPVKGKVINSFRDLSRNIPNKGIDIKADFGAAVVASQSGKVVFLSRYLRYFGNTLIIQHEDGISTVYARNSDVLVALGDNVSRGQTIARVGNSGSSDSPYLHFEIRKRHLPQNPYYYLP